MLRLGRYSDAYKTADQLAAWERSMGHFANGTLAKSFLHFLQYLRDPVEQNIHWIQDRDGGLSFELLQGSRRISGWLGQPYCEAVTTIGLCPSLDEMFMRELLEVNDQLQFCQYGIEEEGRIILRWSDKAEDADPYRLFRHFVNYLFRPIKLMTWLRRDIPPSKPFIAAYSGISGSRKPDQDSVVAKENGGIVEMVHGRSGPP